MLAEIETVPQEEVAMEMLALQTRLQASYEATSLISQLSLVNYLQDRASDRALQTCAGAGRRSGGYRACDAQAGGELRG